MPAVVRRYPRSGMYSEILKVTDAAGRVDYDFAVVQVIDRDHPEQLPPSIHAAYWPTLGLKPGDEVTFKVRTFRIGAHEGRERWDFGDGSPAVEVQSDGNAVPAGQERLCDHDPPLRQAGALPGFGHAEQRPRPSGHGAAACGSGSGQGNGLRMTEKPSRSAPRALDRFWPARRRSDRHRLLRLDRPAAGSRRAGQDLFPPRGPGPFPLVVFSHGTGGSRAGYAFLGEHWASHGYASLHVQHLGSDQAVWQRQPEPMKRMKAAAVNPENATNRPRDVSFAIDQADLLQAGDSPLAGRLDLASNRPGRTFLRRPYRPGRRRAVAAGARRPGDFAGRSRG